MFIDQYNKMANTQLIWKLDDISRFDKFIKKEHTFAEAIFNETRARLVWSSLKDNYTKEMKYIDGILNGKPYQPCFYNVGSYASAFLYFIETDTTIGKTAS